jgi:AcrR family transcriptional regulator
VRESHNKPRQILQTEPGRTNLCPLPVGRRQRKARETRIRIFHAAVQLFSERGFWNVTVENITEAADVGKGTFFNYFKSKDHVLGVMAEIQFARIEEIFPLAVSGKHSIQSLFATLSRKLMEEPGRSPDLARALISAFLSSQTVRDMLNERISEARKQLASLFELGQQRGEIDPHLCIEVLAEQFQQTVMGTILLWTLNGGPSLSERIEQSFQHFWRAVAAPGREQEK